MTDMLWNPYLQEFNDPENHAAYWGLMQRYVLSQKYAWAVPTEEALQELASHGPVIEVGAGTGYWLRCLRERFGLEFAIGYDLHPLETGENRSHKAGTVSYTEVLQGGSDVTRLHADRTLFLCWPNTDGMAATALRHYDGATVVYIGQPNGGDCGATGDPEFHEKLRTEWTLVRTLELPHWTGRCDRMYVYKRKHNA